MNTDNPDHHGSHRQLLWKLDCSSCAKRPPDAIIVPTVRRSYHLLDAADLAIELGCTMVTLHSGNCTSAARARRELPRELDLIAVDVPRERRLPMPHWKISDLLEGTIFAQRSDLSAKRNMGILLGRMLGWGRILFLDDDISGLKPHEIEQVSGMLDVHAAVGLKIGGFPDHSVVCHAYRDSGGDQQTFIGGGALAVDVQRNYSFFPNIYNEDWFYLLGEHEGLQPVATAGEVLQDPFDPFRNPARARTEELGDVLAEGLYWLLDQGGSLADADREHWTAFLANRQSFILRVIQMVAQSDIERYEKRKRIHALHGSLRSLSLISPTLCRMFLEAWAADREKWHGYLDSVPAGLSRRQALNWLSWEGVPRLTAHH